VLGITLSFGWCLEIQKSNSGLSVTTVVPGDHIDLTFEEEIEPVGIWGNDHLLVNSSIRITHDYCGLVLEVLFFVGVEGDLFIVRAGEKHAVNSVPC